MDIMDRKRSNRFAKPELLAPAGDLARAKTAIRYGADAVYLGGQSFSLRSRASNFSMADISEICSYAKEHHAHIHVTVNIIPHEEDFDGLEKYLQELERCGVTAIIAASPAIMKTAREYAPSLQIHCSTQMSVTNSEAASFLHRSLGINRVVLGRECTMDEVYAIAENCPVETEAFIHGGMCVNYSGRCTLSNRMTLRDANRGGCAQSCRWSYHVYDEGREVNGKQLFTMGSKDMMAADYLYDLMNAGVSSLKIEGRMKTEYYVASIVRGYRHLIDAVYDNDGPLSKEEMEKHRQEICRGENRETWPGFYQGSADEKSLIYHENTNADVNHDFLGTVKQIDKENGIMYLEVRNPFRAGEKLEVLTPGYENRTFAAEGLKDEKGIIIDLANHPMSVVSIETRLYMEVGDIVRRAL